MIVDGVLFKERKDLTKTLNDEGVEESHLIHTRVIGERSYAAKKSITDREEEEEEMIETDMDDSQLENFKNEWEEKWNPSIREDEPGILTRFFQMFNPFAWFINRIIRSRIILFRKKYIFLPWIKFNTLF